MTRESSIIRVTASALERWFVGHQRPLPWRRRYHPYQIWVSEVMLQQTRMEVVLPYFQRFLARFPDVASLAKAAERQVLALWSGLGYYRRARMLHAGARAVVQRHRSRIPSDRRELLAIPGIGRYTAGAIASIAFNRPEPVVDGNVARVLARFAALGQPLGSAAFRRRVWELAAQLVAASRSPRHLNQGLMELGAMICRPRNPRCEQCPLAHHCRARTRGKVETFPRAGAARPPIRLEIPLYLVTDRRGRVLMRRESGPLMRKMLHLPHGNSLLLTKSFPSPFTPEFCLGSFSHAVTHRQIRFEVWKARLGEAHGSRRDFLWIDPSQLDRYPHPSYVRKALALSRAVSSQ